MEQNFQLIRQYLSNFKITYKGGRTEGLIHGLIESTPDEGIKYLDFESQYPNAARLCQAWKQIVLGAKGELYKFLDYDVKAKEKDFWKTLEYTVETK